MIVTGMVFRMYPDAGYIDPDRRVAKQVDGNIKFLFDRVEDGRQLFCGDLVECEIENSKHGPRAVWVRWIGHGRGLAEFEERVEGSGYISYLGPDGAGLIRPDIEGADEIEFTRRNITGNSHRIGDRVAFLAHQPDSTGLWKAKSVVLKRAKPCCQN